LSNVIKVLVVKSLAKVQRSPSVCRLRQAKGRANFHHIPASTVQLMKHAFSGVIRYWVIN